MPTEVDRARFRDEDVVFEADAHPLFRDVDARLHRQHPAWLEWPVDRREVVNAEAERVAQSMHEIPVAGGLLDRVLGHLLGRQQAEREKFPAHLHLRRALPVAGHGADRRPRDRTPEHAQDGIVNRPLPRRKPSIHRIGPREVGVVVGIARAHVDQHEVTVAALLVVVEVVERAGACAGADDRLIGHLRPPPGELSEQFGLDFIFHHTRLEHREHATKTSVGHVDRLPEEIDLDGAL